MLKGIKSLKLGLLARCADAPLNWFGWASATTWNLFTQGIVFPHLPKEGMNGAGGQFGKWFGTFKKAKGFTSPSPSFHSFRHLVATELRLAGATDAQADAITGHAGNGVGRQVYAATIRRKAEQLRHVIELLDFPTKQLQRTAYLKR